MSYNLAIAVPAVVLILSLIWMKIVSQESEKKGEGITFDEARADALANEIDSGTEMDDSQTSEKQPTPSKEEGDQEEKTEDEESEIVDEELEVVEKEELEKKDD